MDVVDIDHVAIRVTDLDNVLDFYQELLGLPIRDRERIDAGEVPYVAVAAGRRHMHLVPTDENENEIGGEHVCFLVRSSEVNSRDELSDLLKYLRDHDVEVEPEGPRKRYGAYGCAWATYVRDPDGPRVELKIH